jgi:hypothetical protein
VAPRDVWKHEAHDFTPWLLANADVLSDLLGMDLDLDVAEHPVGTFNLDLMGRDTATGQVVIVENQLEESDHTHLGQLLTYAAGTDPTTIVWIAPSFRPEHRAALDWLNSRTDEATRFFGVQIGVVRIGSSEPAPLFRLIAQPNDWEKTVRSRLDPDGPRNDAYRRFWALYLERIRSERPGWSRASRPPGDNWFSMTAGVAHASYECQFARRGLLSDLLFQHPDANVNAAYLAMLRSKEQEMSAAYGSIVGYEDMERRKATRIAAYLDGASIDDEESWPAYIDWFIDSQTRLRKAVAAAGGLPAPTALLPDVAECEETRASDEDC